jgi:hypothetical protein
MTAFTRRHHSRETIFFNHVILYDNYMIWMTVFFTWWWWFLMNSSEVDFRFVWMVNLSMCWSFAVVECSNPFPPLSRVVHTATAIDHIYNWTIFRRTAKDAIIYMYYLLVWYKSHSWSHIAHVLLNPIQKNVSFQILKEFSRAYILWRKIS